VLLGGFFFFFFSGVFFFFLFLGFFFFLGCDFVFLFLFFLFFFFLFFSAHSILRVHGVEVRRCASRPTENGAVAVRVKPEIGGETHS